MPRRTRGTELVVVRRRSSRIRARQGQSTKLSRSRLRSRSRSRSRSLSRSQPRPRTRKSKSKSTRRLAKKSKSRSKSKTTQAPRVRVTRSRSRSRSGSKSSRSKTRPKSRPKSRSKSRSRVLPSPMSHSHVTRTATAPAPTCWMTTEQGRRAAAIWGISEEFRPTCLFVDSSQSICDCLTREVESMAMGEDGLGTDFPASEWFVTKLLGTGERGVVLETRLRSSPTSRARALKIYREASSDCVSQTEFASAGLATAVFACDRGPFFGAPAYFQWVALIDSTLREWVDSLSDPVQSDMEQMANRAMDLIDIAAQKGMTHGDLTWDNLGVVFAEEKKLPEVYMIDFGYSTSRFAYPLVDYLQLLRTSSYHKTGSAADRRWSWIRHLVIQRIIATFRPWSQIEAVSRTHITTEKQARLVLSRSGLYDDLWVPAFRAYLAKRRSLGEVVPPSTWEDTGPD